MLSINENGLYCKKGNFYIDPFRSVENAVITHGHADHAKWGMEHYFATPATCDIMNVRLGSDYQYSRFNYDTPFQLGDVEITFIPAGHILGSAQVIINDGKQTAIVTGDFKTTPDPTVDQFKFLTCDLLVMETTFALPIYHWPDPKNVFLDIHKFWKQNQIKGHHSVLYAYSLGKAQRLVNGLDSSQGPIAVHPAVDKMNQIYKNYNKLDYLPPTLSKELIKEWDKPGIVIAPPATIGSTWIKKLGKYNEAYVSGWMLSKGQSRRRNMRGFVLSDHADWFELNNVVETLSPTSVWTMHGYTDIYARFLSENGITASPLSKLQLERSE